MELQKAIQDRVSVRNYDPDKKVRKEEIEKLIESAIQAPSWKNSQTARYHIIMNEDKMIEFRDKCLPLFNQKNCENASALIITSFVKNSSGFERATGEPSNEVGNGWGFYDLGLHNENLLLKAVDLGLDSLVMGIRNESMIREMLNIDSSEIIVSVIAIGYALKKTDKPKRKVVSDIATFY